MNDAALFDVQVRSLHDFYRALPEVEPSARLIDLDGVHATVFPTAPDRSICNGVNYSDAQCLDAAYDELAASYAAAAVNAWTVWVPESDTATAAALDRRGHRLDAAPRAMGMELSRFDAAPSAGVEIDDQIEPATVGALNDRAYRLSGEQLEASVRQRSDRIDLYGARIDGEYRACVGSSVSGSDCSIWLVATDPNYRGRGLAGALMVHALTRATKRGCETTTLQATQAGYPIYERLGYRDLGAMQMWEMRAIG